MNGTRLLDDGEIYRLPKPPAPHITPGAFVLCSTSLMGGLTSGLWAVQQALYQTAYQQAVIENTPTILERDLLAVWN